MPKLILKPLPFLEAIEFFKSQIILQAEDYYSLEDILKNLAFTVSRVVAMDILIDIKDAVEKALIEGETVKDFQSRLDDIMIAKGWGGLEPWHINTIFRTNIQSQYNAGRFTQVAKMKNRFYLEYDATEDDRTTELCQNLDGKIYPVKDNFWRHFTPPNHFNCFPPGTKVLTPSGWNQIESIKIGDFVIGGSGNKCNVTTIYRNSFNGELVRIISKDYTFSATPNHRILTLNGWKRADAIKTGDILVQTKEKKFFDSLIHNIDKSNIFRHNQVMPIPIKRISTDMSAFDPEINGRNKNINPFRAFFGLYNIIMNRIKSKAFNVIKNDRFTFCELCFTVCMRIRILFIEFFYIYFHFISKFSGAISVKFNHSFRSFFCSFINILGAAKTRLSPFFDKLPSYIFYGLSCFDTSFWGRMQPLRANSFATISNRDVVKINHIFNRTNTYFPFFSQLAERKFFSNISFDKSFFDGAPLDRFNTLNSFRSWAKHNCILHRVIIKDTISHNGIVVNLSIENDKTYIIEGATVHNCRSSTRPVHKYEVEERKLDIETEDIYGQTKTIDDPITGEKVEFEMKPAEGFDKNPATRPYKPDLSKYPKELQDIFKQDQKANKIK